METAVQVIVLGTAIIGGTGLFCGAILAIAAHYLAVHEDPRVEAVTAMLPGINCGGCGDAGCSEYARGIVLSGKAVNLCKPGGSNAAQRIAAFMGVDAGSMERHVALVLCSGSRKTSRWISAYNGIADCAGGDLVGGAGKACRFGCLGFGSCSRVCPVGAIEVTDSLAVVHPELCIGCGLCTTACPRKLIKLIPESAFIHVLCSSTDRGQEVKKVCDVGCIGCTLCFKTAGGQGIRMEGALAVVDYGGKLVNEAVIEKCPQGTIVKRSGLRQEAKV